MDPSRAYITHVIRNNKSVLFRSSTRTVILLVNLEVPGESLPQSTKYIEVLGGLIFFTLLEAAFGYLRKARTLPGDSHPN